jgi:hypothetical protein
LNAIALVFWELTIENPLPMEGYSASPFHGGEVQMRAIPAALKANSRGTPDAR